MMRKLGSGRVSVFLLGSIVIGASSGAGIVYAFKGFFPGVYLAFLGFVTGYKVFQIEVYDEGLVEYFSRRFREEGIKPQNVLLAILGTVSFSYGFILFAKSIQSFNPLFLVIAGALIGGGYAATHRAVNGSLI